MKMLECVTQRRRRLYLVWTDCSLVPVLLSDEWIGAWADVSSMTAACLVLPRSIQ